MEWGFPKSVSLFLGFGLGPGRRVSMFVVVVVRTGDMACSWSSLDGAGLDVPVVVLSMRVESCGWRGVPYTESKDVMNFILIGL